MTELTVITNNVPRDIVDAWELTAAEREEFDYINWPAVEQGSDSASFFRYKGELYDLGDCETWSSAYPPSPISAWDGFYSETFFSGVLVKYVDDHERVIVGRYYS